MKRWIFFSLLTLCTLTVRGQFVADSLVLLQDVEINGTRAIGGEVKRLEVESRLSSAPATVADALRQIPSLSTDIEGNITFRGSDKTYVLLHHTPYGLLEEYRGDMLIQLPALFFNRVEVHSFPSIEWVPDGDAGVLNLSSLKNDNSPVSLLLGGGWNDRFSAGTMVHLHPGRFHLLARYDYRHEYRKRSFCKITTDEKGTTEMNNNASARPDTHVADLTVSTDLTQNDYLTFYGLYYRMDYDRYGGIHNTRRNPHGEVVNRVLRHRYNRQNQQAYAAEIDWIHFFSRPEDHLEVMFNYNNFIYDEDNDFENENPQTGTIVARDNLFIRQKKDNYYGAVKLRKTLADRLFLKSGYIARYKREHATADAHVWMGGEEWSPNAQKSDNYRFSRLTQMIYLSLEKEWENVSAEVGIQAEHSRQEASEWKRNNIHFYPRFRLSFQPDESNHFRLGYQQRVVRPTGAELNPFTDYSDATYVWKGNPELDNEIIHSLELGYGWGITHFRLSPALYFRHKQDRMVNVFQYVGGNGFWQKCNVGNSNQYGAELIATWFPVRWLTFHLSGNIFRDEIDGSRLGYGQKKSMSCWDVKGGVTLHITRQTDLQIDGYHISDQLTAQGRIQSRSTINAGVSHYLFDRRLRLNLSVNNILDSLEEVTVIDTSDLFMKQIRNRDARVGWLTAGYHF